MIATKAEASNEPFLPIQNSSAEETDQTSELNLCRRCSRIVIVFFPDSSTVFCLQDGTHLALYLESAISLNVDKSSWRHVDRSDGENTIYRSQFMSMYKVLSISD